RRDGRYREHQGRCPRGDHHRLHPADLGQPDRTGLDAGDRVRVPDSDHDLQTPGPDRRGNPGSRLMRPSALAKVERGKIIVTLAFGEIIFTIATNGDAVEIGGYKLTEGQQAISPVDQPKLPGFSQFDSAFSLRGYFWLGLIMAVIVLLINLALRESRLGRA